MQQLRKTIRENFSELYVGALLIIGVPLIGYFYLDIRAFFAITVIIQSVIGVLYLRKGGK